MRARGSVRKITAVCVCVTRVAKRSRLPATMAGSVGVRPRSRCAVEDQRRQRVAFDQVQGDGQGVCAVAWADDQQPVEVEAAAVQVVGVAGARQIEPGDQRVALRVRGRQNLGRQRHLAGGRRADDLRDPPARQPAAERAHPARGRWWTSWAMGSAGGAALRTARRAVLQLQPRHDGVELALAVGWHVLNPESNFSSTIA